MPSVCYLFFETLATRLKSNIIALLSEGPASVSEISKKLGQERSKVSHALLSLSGCGFVNARKKGQQRIYSLNGKIMTPLMKLIDRHSGQYCLVCRKKKR